MTFISPGNETFSLLLHMVDFSRGAWGYFQGQQDISSDTSLAVMMIDFSSGKEKIVLENF